MVVIASARVCPSRGSELESSSYSCVRQQEVWLTQIVNTANPTRFQEPTPSTASNRNTLRSPTLQPLSTSRRCICLLSYKHHRTFTLVHHPKRLLYITFISNSLSVRTGKIRLLHRYCSYRMHSRILGIVEAQELGHGA